LLFSIDQGLGVVKENAYAFRATKIAWAANKALRQTIPAFRKRDRWMIAADYTVSASK